MSGSDEDSDDPIFKEDDDNEDEDEGNGSDKKASGSGSGGGLNMAGFLFGNIDTEGRLTSGGGEEGDGSDDYLDPDSKAKLSGLAQMLNSSGGGGMPDLFTDDDKVVSPREKEN